MRTAAQNKMSHPSMAASPLTTGKSPMYQSILADAATESAVL